MTVSVISRRLPKLLKYLRKEINVARLGTPGGGAYGKSEA